MNPSNKFYLTQLFIFFLTLSSSYCLVDKKLNRNTYSSQHSLSARNTNRFLDTVYDCSSSSPIKDICTICSFSSDYQITFAASKSALGDDLLTASLPSYDPKVIANSLLSSDLYKFANSLGLLSASLEDPEIMVNLGATQAIRFEAIIQLFGEANVTIDLLAVKGGGNFSSKGERTCNDCQIAFFSPYDRSSAICFL